MPRPAPLRAVPDPTGGSVERGDIVLGWLTRIVLLLAVAGVGLFDAISVGTTAINLSDQGSFAAREASEVWQTTGSMQQAYDAAVAYATEQDPDNVVSTKGFLIDADDTVHLTLRRKASSFLLYRWDRTAGWAEVEREASGRSVA